MEDFQNTLDNMQHNFVSLKSVLLTLTLGGTSAAQAQFNFSGDFDLGTGQLQLTSPITFNVIDGGFLTYIVFDDIVTYDGDFTVQADSVTFSILQNSLPTPNSQLDFIDNFNNVIGNIDSSDGALQFSFFDEFFIGPGDTVTIQAGTWNNLGTTNFNSQYNSAGNFAGNIRLMDSNGTILAEHVSAVPEPSSVALLGFGFLALARRKRA